MGEQIPCAIIGASGYTGAELVRLLAGHPQLQLRVAMAKRAAGQALADVWPHVRSDLAIEAFSADEVAARAKVAFCCLPHGESAPIVAELVTRGLLVLDLSADFRLHDAEQWRTWYASAEHPAHPAAGLLPSAVYGLPELHRAALRGARLIAVPGCYATAAILATAPLLAAGLIASGGIVIDAKSGASGAGRTPGLATHLPEAAEGVRAYKVAGAHRHTAEIEQELGEAAGAPLAVLFTPHLLPMSRGILSCTYATPTREADFRDALARAYAHEPFIDVLAPGKLPDTAHVRGSNRVQLTAVHDPRTRRVLVISALDNLVKGASGQAVQCANLALGLPETAGLDQVALFP